MIRKYKDYNLPYSVIKGAMEGEAEAIRRVWRQYDSYMNTLCARPYQDYYGNIRFMIDWDMKDFLKMQLAWAIMHNFNDDYESVNNEEEII